MISKSSVLLFVAVTQLRSNINNDCLHASSLHTNIKINMFFTVQGLSSYLKPTTGSLIPNHLVVIV